MTCRVVGNASSMVVAQMREGPATGCPSESTVRGQVVQQCLLPLVGRQFHDVFQTSTRRDVHVKHLELPRVQRTATGRMKLCHSPGHLVQCLP